MKRNQSGFSVVEIIMAIVIIGLLAMVGWLYWQNTAKDNAATSSKQATSPQKVSSNNKIYTSSKYGFSFEYPMDWIVESNKELNGEESGVLIKSPEFKIVNGGEGDGVSGNYIDIGTTKAWNASISYWESQQQPADPNSTFGHFTFAGKPAVIWRGTTAQDTKKPPVPSLSDMYKGENTWIQGKSIIYMFTGSTGVDFYYSGKSPSDKIKGDGNQEELYKAIKIVLDSWKWL